MTGPAEAGSDKAEAAAVDLRCVNHDCMLFGLKLEPDEVAPEPDTTPDRCAACGTPLEPHGEA